MEILDAFAEEETVVWTQWHWTDSDGVLLLNLFGDLGPGEYRLRITDLTDPDHVQIITDEWVTVLSGNNISVTVTPENIAIGESAEAKVLIAFGEVDPNTGIPARGLPGREVTVTVTEFMYNTGTYSGVTDSEGIARIPVGYDLQPGWLTVFATDELTGATSASVQLSIVTMDSMRISAPELSTETIAYRQQPPPNPLRVRASEELLLEATSLWSMTFPEAVPTWACDPPAAGTFTFNAGLETAFYVADPLWRGTLTITARVGSETLTAQVVYVGVHHTESGSPTASMLDTVVFTAYPDPQNESFPMTGGNESALTWTSEPDLGAPTVTVYPDRVEASFTIPQDTSGLVEVKAISGSSEGKAFVFVDNGSWVITPQPAVVGQDDVLMMTATQEGVTGMGAWMTKADFELLWEILTMTLAQSDIERSRRMLSAMVDMPNLTPPPLVAELVTEGMPVLRVTVTDWNWMEAVEELIINGQTVDTSGWGIEEWETLLAQPMALEWVFVVTQDQQVVAQRTIRAVISELGANWHGVNTGNVEVVFIPLEELENVYLSVSSNITWHAENGVRGSADEGGYSPYDSIAEATLWVVNVGRVLAKDWMTGATAETVRLSDGSSGEIGELTVGVGVFVTLQAFINPEGAPKWPQDKPYWESVDPPQNSTAIFTTPNGTDLTRFGPQGEEGDYTVHVSSSSPLSVVVRAMRLGVLTLDSNNDRRVDEQDEPLVVKLNQPGFVFWVKEGGADRPRMDNHLDLEDFAVLRLQVERLGNGRRYQLRWSPANQLPNSQFGLAVYPRFAANYLTQENDASTQLSGARQHIPALVRPNQPWTIPEDVFALTAEEQQNSAQQLTRWLLIAGIQPGAGFLELVESDAQGNIIHDAQGNPRVLDAVYLTIRLPQDLYMIGNARKSMNSVVDFRRFKYVNASHRAADGRILRQSVFGWIEGSRVNPQPQQASESYKYPGDLYVTSTRFTEVRLEPDPNGPSLATIDIGPQIFAERNPVLLQRALGQQHVVVAIHGFNIGENYVGWFNRMYKRLYWAGWDGAFLGITWDGDTYKKSGKGINELAANFNYFNFDVENALRSGQAIADVIHNLKVRGWQQVSIITHSLGVTAAGEAMYDLATRTRVENIQRPWLHRVIHMQAAQGYNSYGPPADSKTATAPEFFNTRHAERGMLHELRQQPWRGIFRVAVEPQAQVVVPNGIINTYSESDKVLKGWFAVNEGHGGLISLWGFSTLVSKGLASVWPQAIFRQNSVYRELVWESTQARAMGLGGASANNHVIPTPQGNITNIDAERVEDPLYPGVQVFASLNHSYMINGEPYWKVGRVWRNIVTQRLP